MFIHGKHGDGKVWPSTVSGTNSTYEENFAKSWVAIERQARAPASLAPYEAVYVDLSTRKITSFKRFDFLKQKNFFLSICSFCNYSYVCTYVATLAYSHGPWSQPRCEIKNLQMVRVLILGDDHGGMMSLAHYFSCLRIPAASSTADDVWFFQTEVR